MLELKREPASFRDPQGFVFQRHGTIYRRIERSYKEHYDRLMESGLYRELTKQGLLVEHEEQILDSEELDGAYKIVKPQRVPFVSYPYEWSFNEFRDAALATLEIARIALEHGMTLKDATAYNVQFHNGKALLIDTLSFETYQEGQPWIAYRQFCEHFLAPLALMCSVDLRLNKLLQTHIDGVPLDLACSLLPKRLFINPSLFIHLPLHAHAQKKYAGKSLKEAGKGMSKISVLALLDNLSDCVRSLQIKEKPSEWSEYYDNTNYSENGLDAKEKIVADFLGETGAKTVWDIGANTGRFSRIAASLDKCVVSMDIDPLCVDRNYRACKQDKETKILPLVLDLTAPSPSIGWNNQERHSLAERGPADTVMALALVHHLAIANNVPLSMVAQFMAGISRQLIIEFVPKSDSQVQRLLSSRKDIFDGYDEANFVHEFSLYFDIIKTQRVPESERTIYLMKRINS